jgi:hypothetical protein
VSKPWTQEEADYPQFYNCLTTYTAGNAFMNRRRLDEKYFGFSFL